MNANTKQSGKSVKSIECWGIMKWNKHMQQHILLPYANRTLMKCANGAETNAVGCYKMVKVLITPLPRKVKKI